MSADRQQNWPVEKDQTWMVVMALPRTAVTLTWLTLPAASRDDLAGMIELEAAQTLPFSVEEAAWDFAS